MLELVRRPRAGRHSQKYFFSTELAHSAALQKTCGRRRTLLGASVLSRFPTAVFYMPSSLALFY